MVPNRSRITAPDHVAAQALAESCGVKVALDGDNGFVVCSAHPLDPITRYIVVPRRGILNRQIE
ncbi:hypothetical protein [Aureimonas altamirensis]|uniref:hypothetical protein n=1 Tax=Aureimonas altamirensis TaxID=370622 RepID=UPI0030173131